ncbi:MAG: DUF2970 domain-containing protein [Immundisolibacteraceae bacterium]|nr:DUF2970 domain-containing protein [Immundisolibacteraceae bacterium]
MPDAENSAPINQQQRLGFFALLREILWSFLGVRSSLGYEKTFALARPRDIILVGIFATLVFVILLVGVAYMAISLATT